MEGDDSMIGHKSICASTYKKCGIAHIDGRSASSFRKIGGTHVKVKVDHGDRFLVMAAIPAA